MRPVVLLLLVAGSCSFNPSGGGSDDIDAPTDAMEIDACVPVAETCEGTDQDCDGTIDEGFATGDPCDGPDLDSCPDDLTICNAQGVVGCGDTSGDNDEETCNGINDDCDGMTDEGFMVNAMCDGADTDLCTEGVFSCTSAGQVCSDETGDTVEDCNGADDDCNGVIDNGFDLQGDVMNCGECDHVCTNSLGGVACTAGDCTPTCNLGAADCNGNPDDGCELQNTNPTCNPAAATEFTVNADVDDTETITGTSERFMRVRIRETDGGNAIDLTATLQLTHGAGVDYDLYVYCPNCNATPLNEADDSVNVGRSDGTGDRSFDIWVEVRLDGSTTTCAAWTLNIFGNSETTERC